MDRDEQTKRSFNEQQVGALIRRASELATRAEQSPQQNLSVGEVEHIAWELGLDPKYVRMAIREMDERLRGGGRREFWGGPFLIEEARAAEGALTDERWEQIIDELRRSTGSVGKTIEMGARREWMRSIKDLTTTLETTHLTVRPESEGASVRLTKRFGGAAFIAYAMAMLAGVTVAGVVVDGAGFSELVDLAIVAGGGVGSMGMMRLAVPLWLRRQRARLSRLADRVQSVLSNSTPEITGELATAATPIAIPDADEDAPVSAVRSGQPRRTRPG